MFINSRILLRTDSSINWEANPNFVPLNGEVCIYDNKKMKIGDGVTSIVNLPFAFEEQIRNYVEEILLGSEW